MADIMDPELKLCSHCRQPKPVTDFLRRTGRRAGKHSRRGQCRQCRIERKTKSAQQAHTSAVPAPPSKPLRTPEPAWRRPPLPAPPPKPDGPDVSVLRTNRLGKVGMRGRTDKGRRWYQETDLETAVTLVEERAAVVVNRHTIRRLYTNRAFRQYILKRDRHTCYFCGQPGDTIDHLLPRAKGGHTTPMNCVCACNLCNQSKADRDFDDFVGQERP